ncbi:unnamed protein product, partial [Heligmosomoides polygyrus]|uniref:Oxidored_molyb domain-containing protein n=1 Tax=Heligmosomoides polygyrus TaxID=6339 RepID=A0A183GKG7_HELPZ
MKQIHRYDGRIPRIGFGTTPWLMDFATFCLRNEPFVLQESFTADWPARQLWVRGDGSPDLDYLRKNYGEQVVPVLVEGRCDPEEMTSPTLYLKDWHFQRSCGTTMYHVPPILSSDWVNREIWTDDDENPFRGDYRFVYFGVRGTWRFLYSRRCAAYRFFAPPGGAASHSY